MNADIQFDFFLFYPVLDPIIHNNTSYIQGDSSTSSDPIYRFACRYAQRFISMVTLNPIKSTIRIKYHSCHSNIMYLNEMMIYLKRMAFYSPCMLFSWDFIENMKYERKLAVHHGSFSKLFLLTSTLYSLIKKLHSQLLTKDPCAQSTF